jgi:hypothetical protein
MLTKIVEIDDSSASMWDTFEKAQQYRAETLAYARYALDLTKTDPGVTNGIILNFKTIADAVCQRYDLGK